MLKKVLIVDDSELIHNMYRMMLKKYEGCALTKAFNGREALDKLAIEDDFDLILLDINMPVMNGLQFLECLHSEKKYDHIPVVIISTEGKEDDTIKGLNLGAKGYIVKPFKSDSLHTLIQNLLANKARENTEGAKGPQANI
jgi:two-component system, chemotaxis family, chemotaxis protein CheY